MAEAIASCYNANRNPAAQTGARVELRQLKYFAEVAELRSFTRAAVTLRIAQPALSRQVRLLEEELGLQLLHRNGRGVSLTPAGTELLGRSSHLVAEFAEIRRDMIKRSRTDAKVMSLTVGLPISVSSLLAPILSARFKARLPDAVVRVVAGHSGLIPDWLISGGVDLAILFGNPHNSRIACQPIGMEDLFAIIGPNSPLAGRSHLAGTELATLPLVLPQRPHAIWDVLDRGGIRPGRTISADTLEEIIKLAQNNEGTAILPLVGLAAELTAKRLIAVPIRRPRLSRPVMLSRLAGRKATGVERSVSAILRAEVRALMRSGGWPVSAAPAGGS